MENFKIIRDVPAFGDVYDFKNDKFNHKVYADTLANIIKNNEAPLIIGLLGDWGAGKSTILNILRRKLTGEYKFVYFNSWKYAKDSFRRQFLIEAAKEIIPNKAEQEKFIEGLNVRFTKELGKNLKSFKEVIDYVKTITQRSFTAFLIISIALFLMVSVFFIVGALSNNNWLILGAIVCTFPLSAILKEIFKTIIPDIFKIDTDPQLILPEQFESEFTKLISKVNQEIVFIIDDIDRCSSQMIIEILDSAKTFFAPEKCYFVLAMDDKAVTDILIKEKGDKYREEEILKFVDVSVKLAYLSSADLVEFSKAIARETKIPEDAIQIGIYGGFDTPRKIKHFLNGFKILYWIAKQREDDKIFNYNVEKIVANLAKILVLQTAFYEDFISLKENPKLLDEWNERAHLVFEEGSQLVDKDNPALLRFLWATRETPILDLESILHLKIPEYAVSLPSYSEFKNSLLNGEIAEIKTLSQKIESTQQAENLVSLVNDILYLKNPTELFLKNILDGSLEIYHAVNFEKRKKDELRGILIRHLLSYKKILTFNPMVVFGLFDNIEGTNVDFKNLITLCWEDILRRPNSAHVSSYINLLYEKGLMEIASAGNINKNLNEHVKKEPKWVVDVLKEIKIPDGKEWKDIKNKVPSHDIMSTSLIPLIDEKESEVKFFESIVDASFKFWDKSFESLFLGKCLQLSQKFYSNRKNKLDNSMRMVLRIIKDMPVWMGQQNDTLSSTLHDIMNQLSDLNEKGDVLESFAIVAYSSQSKDSYVQTVTDQALGFNEIELKKILQLIDEYSDIEWWGRLKTNLVNHIVSATNSDPNKNNLERFKLIYPDKNYPVSQAQVQGILNRVLQNSNYISVWKEFACIIAMPAETGLWLVSNIKELIKKVSPVSHKELLLDLLLAIVHSREEEQGKIDLGSYIFDIVNHVQELNTSNVGRKYLKSAEFLMGERLFQIKLNVNINELIKKDAIEIIQLKNIFLDFLSFKKYIQEETFKNCIDSIIDLIASNDSNRVSTAKELLTAIDKIPQDKIKKIEETISLISDAAKRNEIENLIKERK